MWRSGMTGCVPPQELLASQVFARRSRRESRGQGEAILASSRTRLLTIDFIGIRKVGSKRWGMYPSGKIQLDSPDPRIRTQGPAPSTQLHQYQADRLAPVAICRFLALALSLTFL